jgi:predicted DNA-binding transcriptional regulator AlpA
MRAQKFDLMQHGAESIRRAAPVQQTLESSADRLLKIAEAAQFLNVAPGSLYHLVSQGRVPCIHLSKRCLRFRMADLQAWIATKKSSKP